MGMLIFNLFSRFSLSRRRVAWAGALDAEVQAAEAKKLAVVINAQTESDPLSGREQDPTHATFIFWNCVTQPPPADHLGRASQLDDLVG